MCSVLIGYLAIGGNISVIFQPFEWMIIVGAAIGSYMIANPPDVSKAMLKSLKKLSKRTPYTKTEYIELLVFMFNFFKIAHTKGPIEIENHIDNPDESELFSKYPVINKSEEALIFFCDYFRMVALGFENTLEIENMMEIELNEKRKYSHKIAHSLLRMGDGLPALGIVAAVLGVITTMASVSSDASVLGPKIASALVGTFIGAFTAYGIVNPIGYFLDKYGNDEIKFLECMKAGMIAHINGSPPSISVEFARQVIQENLKPSFSELEKEIENRLSADKVITNG